MKTVLLLGAGASVAEAKSQGVSNNKLPPTDRDFFTYVYRYWKSSYFPIQRYAMKEFGVHLQDPNFGMEILFNWFYQSTIDKLSKPTIKDDLSLPRAIANYRLLRNSLQRAIAKSTNGVNPRNDQIKKSRSDLAKIINYLVGEYGVKNTTIMTFNYDLLVEKALEFLSLECYYQCDFIGTISHLPNDKSLKSISTKQSENTIPLLKLHGSLNWQSKGDIDNSINQKLFPERADIELYMGRKIPSIASIRRPVIVPPIYEKSSIFGKILNPIWEQTSRALRDMNRIVIFGYSLPEADIRAQIVLSSNLATTYAKTRKRPRVDIIDTNPEVCERYANRLQLDSLNYYQFVDEFIVRNS